MIARRAGVKTLVLTHVLAQIDQPGIREQIVHEIQQEFDGQRDLGRGPDAAHACRIGACEGRREKKDFMPGPAEPPVSG